MDIKITENMKEKAFKYLEAFVVSGDRLDIEAVINRIEDHTALLRACMDDNRIIYCDSELPELKMDISKVTDNLDTTIGLPLGCDFDPAKYANKLAVKLTEAILNRTRTCGAWDSPVQNHLITAIRDLLNMRVDYIDHRIELKTCPYVFNEYVELFKRADVNGHMLGDFTTKYLAYLASRIHSAEDTKKAAHLLFWYREVLLNVYKAMYHGYITPKALFTAKLLCGCYCPGILIPTDEHINKNGYSLYCPFDVAQALAYPVTDCLHSDLRDITKDILMKIKQGE